MTQATAQDVFDLEGLSRRMMGDRELMAEIVSEFVADLSSQITGLRASIANGDERSIARQIHTIKGASANVGAKGLERLARGAESAGLAKQTERADAFVLSLVEHFELFKTAVQENGYLREL